MTRRLATNILRTLFIAIGITGATGCSIAQTDSVTIQAELPPNFSVRGTASYQPATGETCILPPRQGKNVPGRKFFDQEQQSDTQTASFQVPLTDKAAGCPLTLKSFEFALEGKFGPGPVDVGQDYARLSFQDGPPTSATPPLSTPPIFNGQCQWLFRTIGPKRYIVKILKCRAADENGEMLKYAAGGVLNRNQLAGKTVKMVLKLSEEELPYMGDTWVKFPNGWKRCMGDSLEDPYAFCRGNTTDFKPFKMRDGRDCTVYPNCTE